MYVNGEEWLEEGTEGTWTEEKREVPFKSFPFKSVVFFYPDHLTECFGGFCLFVS